MVAAIHLAAEVGKTAMDDRILRAMAKVPIGPARRPAFVDRNPSSRS
jgi:hypothetical protein